MSNKASEFIEINELNTTIVLDVKYATTTNLTGKIIYPQARCYLRRPAAHALDLVQKDLNKNTLLRAVKLVLQPNFQERAKELQENVMHWNGLKTAVKTILDSI